MKEVRKSRFLWKIALLIVILALSVEIGKAQNIKPVADAGSSRYAGPDPVVLDGTGSYDPDNSGTLNYTWRQISGPSVVIIDDNTATPTIAGNITTSRGGIPKLSGFIQTEEIQECEFELIVSDGEFISLPDTVNVIIVPNFGENILRLANDSFDPNKPTYIWFAGGDCIVRTPYEETFHPNWLSKTNMIHFPYYEPDPHYKPGDVDAPRTYYRCGDMIIVYLSSAAPDYHQPIQSGGWSTGGQPAIDVGIHLNLTYADARYAVNRVTLVDARACRDFSDSILLFLDSAVDGEQCWIDNHRGGTDGPFPSWPSFYPNVLRVGSSLSHTGVQSWYANSLTYSDMNQFNHGVVGGAYWSVIGPGKNLQLASTPGVETYSFKWVGTESYGHMDFWDEPNHPGRLPEPVTLAGPEDGAIVDANGAVLSCEESENVIGYQLLFGSNPYRVMDYDIVSDTPNPPTEIITSFPYDQTWWTIRVYDSFGSTIYADPRCVIVAFPTNAEYSGGTGEPNDPYLIYTAEQMNAIGAEPNDWDKHFKLMADIDLSIYTGTDFNIIGYTGTDFNMIDRNNAFTGVFDGNGHIISNFSYTSTDKRYIGLFGCVGATGTDAMIAIGKGKDAMIKDLELIEPNVDAGTGDDVGALVGGLSLGTITNCSVKGGTVSGNRRIGGLVGFNFGGEITNCYVTGNVEGVNDVGGLVGINSSSFGKRAEITNCYSVSSVTGNKIVGGLVGNNHSVWAAFMWRATISNCYSIGNVFGIEYVGSLVGDNTEGGSIIKCYAAGRVTGTTVVGGLVGDNSYYPSTITASFWDIETSGRSNMCGIEVPGGSGCDDVNGKTTAEMQTTATFLEAGWDFVDETENGTEDIWWIDEGQDYPRLWWEWPADDMLFLVVDDFESYNDINVDEPGSNRIYLIWVDGYDNPAINGSVVGFTGMIWWPPKLHSGLQSMPFDYDNAVGKSEATADVDNLAIGSDWTIKGVDILSLWFHGHLRNDAEPMYVALADDNGTTGVSYHDNPDAAQIEKWTEWTIDLQLFADQGVNLTNINTISIGFGDKNNPEAGGLGKMYFDDIRLYRSAP